MATKLRALDRSCRPLLELSSPLFSVLMYVQVLFDGEASAGRRSKGRLGIILDVVLHRQFSALTHREVPRRLEVEWLATCDAN